MSNVGLTPKVSYRLQVHFEHRNQQQHTQGEFVDSMTDLTRSRKRYKELSIASKEQQFRYKRLTIHTCIIISYRVLLT